MPTLPRPSPLRRCAAVVAALTLTAGSLSVAAGAARDPGSDPAAHQRATERADHLVISEVMTGGTSASDEFVELYNPTADTLGLADLELVYVSSSGATVTRKASWDAGAIPPFEHLLVANDAGIFASAADERYTGGLSATGGTLALREADTEIAIDAVGWGSAANAWTEGATAPAPQAGASIERLPGGEAGSHSDSDDNSVDFVVRDDPEPQNSESPPITGATPAPSSSPTPTATPEPSASAPETTAPSPSASIGTPPASPTSTPSATSAPTTSGTPAPAAVPISTARTLPAGSQVTVSGVALTSSSFNDGGGYLADETGGIAVLLSGVAFERGERLQVTGHVGDRYHQWTLRADADDVARLGSASDPAAPSAASGDVGEQHEGELVQLSGTLVGSPAELSSGIAFELDDGSGPVRVLVLHDTGIDTTEWRSGTGLELRGVVGQRDSSGTGALGYRVQPRASSDVLAVEPPDVQPTASPTPSRSAASPTPTPGGHGVVAIADARGAAPGAQVTVRGVVTAPTGRLVDDGAAVIQDSSAGLLLRVNDDQPTLDQGSVVEVTGERATRAGMATLRVTTVTHLGMQPEPDPTRLSTGAAGEEHEARLVVVRGVVSSAIRDSSTGSVSFDVDDGSGALRVFAFAATGIASASVERGSWVEVRGVLGQETSGDRVAEGYRVWPRHAGDIRVVAPAIPEAPNAANAGAGGSRSDGSSTTDRPGPTADLPQDLERMVVAGGGAATARATLVTGRWPELDLAGVLWDGARVIGVSTAADAASRVEAAGATPPVVLELRGVARAGTLGPLPGMVLELAPESAVRAVDGDPLPPATTLPPPGEIVWGRVAGTLGELNGAATLAAGDVPVVVEYACRDAEAADDSPPGHGSPVLADGLLASRDGGATLIVPCGGIRPAPALAAGSPGHAPAERATSGTGSNASPAQPADGPAAPALLAAGALGIALLGVVGALAWRWGTIGRLIEAYRSPSSRDERQGGVNLDDTG